MKKLRLKFDGMDKMLIKEQMKTIKGGDYCGSSNQFGNGKKLLGWE